MAIADYLDATLASSVGTICDDTFDGSSNKRSSTSSNDLKNDQHVTRPSQTASLQCSNNEWQQQQLVSKDSMQRQEKHVNSSSSSIQNQAFAPADAAQCRTRSGTLYGNFKVQQPHPTPPHPPRHPGHAHRPFAGASGGNHTNQPSFKVGSTTAQASGLATRYKASQYKTIQDSQDQQQLVTMQRQSNYNTAAVYQPGNQVQGPLHAAAAVAGNFGESSCSSQGSDSSRWVCYSALECEEDLEYSSACLAQDHHMEEPEQADAGAHGDKTCGPQEPTSGKARLYMAVVSIYTEQNSPKALAHANAIMSSLRLPGEHAREGCSMLYSFACTPWHHLLPAMQKFCMRSSQRFCRRPSKLGCMPVEVVQHACKLLLHGF